MTYSVIDANSFKSLDYWLKQLDDHIDINKIVIYIVGNKNDVHRDERQIMYSEG